MSRNDMFLLFACLCAAAIMAGPVPILRAPPVKIVSLFSPAETGPVLADTAMLQHSFDQQ